MPHEENVAPFQPKEDQKLEETVGNKHRTPKAEDLLYAIMKLHR